MWHVNQCRNDIIGGNMQQTEHCIIHSSSPFTQAFFGTASLQFSAITCIKTLQNNTFLHSLWKARSVEGWSGKPFQRVGATAEKAAGVGSGPFCPFASRHL